MASLPSPAELNSRFAVPGVARFDAGAGGLTRLFITGPRAEAELFLHGAHLVRFQPRGQANVLFLSAASHFEAGKAIRGGVPIIFPWFGPRQGHPQAAMHGFARLREWAVESVRLDEGAVEVVLTLGPDEGTRGVTGADWPHEFALRFRARVGRSLSMTLEVRNTGGKPFEFEEALHTYFAVSDARRVAITGLEGCEYVDKADQFRRKRQGDEPVRIEGETDRVYLATRAACAIDDPGGGAAGGAVGTVPSGGGVPRRRITLEKQYSDATVVWNPWVAKAKAMADFGDDEWPGMVCVETCNVGESAVTLPAGATHAMTATVRCD